MSQNSFFTISKQNPSVCVPFSNAISSFSSCLALQSLLTSNPEITRLDFSSSAFSALDGTRSWPYSMTTTSFVTVGDSVGRPGADYMVQLQQKVQMLSDCSKASHVLCFYL